MFFTQWARCHWTERQSSSVTSAQPGKSRPVRLDQRGALIVVRLPNPQPDLGIDRHRHSSALMNLLPRIWLCDQIPS